MKKQNNNNKKKPTTIEIGPKNSTHSQASAKLRRRREKNKTHKFKCTISNSTVKIEISTKKRIETPMRCAFGSRKFRCIHYTIQLNTSRMLQYKRCF